MNDHHVDNERNVNLDTQEKQYRDELDNKNAVLPMQTGVNVTSDPAELIQQISVPREEFSFLSILKSVQPNHLLQNIE